MADSDAAVSIAVLGAECGELAKRIGNVARQADRLGMHAVASALIDALPLLADGLGARAAKEVDSVQMELAKALASNLAEVPGG